MARLILLLVVGVAAWALVKKIIAANSQESQPHPLEAQAMKRCSQCGVYLPESEALEKDGRHFCCADHRDGFKA